MLSQFLASFWHLSLEAAPWLLLGFFIAGAIKVFLPQDVLSKQLGGSNFITVVKAAFIGAPLPLCSCGVIPTALGLRKSGASKAATASFLVATPETGVDSIGITYALLGPIMAIARPIAALISAIAAGWSVSVIEKKERQTVIAHDEGTLSASSCCSSKKTDKEKVEADSSCCSSTVTAAEENKIESSCCGSKVSTAKVNFPRLKSWLKYSLGNMVEDTATWLLIGLAFAALVDTFVPTSYMTEWGTSIWAMLVMVVISIPMYVCATASTPIAAGLLLAGVSPGGILVFMLTGPATNMALLGLVGKEFGKKSLMAYLSGIIIPAVLMGLLLDFILDKLNLNVVVTAAMNHEMLPNMLSVAAVAVLVLAMLWNLYNRLRKA